MIGWRSPSRKIAIVDIEAETTTTGTPVCWETWSAER